MLWRAQCYSGSGTIRVSGFVPRLVPRVEGGLRGGGVGNRGGRDHTVGFFTDRSICFRGTIRTARAQAAAQAVHPPPSERETERETFITNNNKPMANKRMLNQSVVNRSLAVAQTEASQSREGVLTVSKKK